MKKDPRPAMLLPPTPRLLRGLRSALAELDTTGRPDLVHCVKMIDIVAGHLLLREDLEPYPPLYADLLALVGEGDRYLPAASAEVRQRLQQAASGLAVDLPVDRGFDIVQGSIAEALACLRDRLALAVAAGGEEATGYIRRVQAAEYRFYAANYRPIPTSATSVPPTLTREAFEPYLLDRFPGRYRKVPKFQRLVGGFQKETIMVDAELANGSLEALVVRAEKHDRFVKLTASEIVDEYAIVRRVFEQGITVAEPLWLEDDPSRLGRRFMVSRRAAGRNTGDATGNSGAFTPTLTRSLVETLARIHTLPIDETLAATPLGRWLAYPRMPDNTREEIRTWRHQIWMDRAPPSPAHQRLFDWLEANVPPDEEPLCLLHNDYGPHNILVDGDRVAAVLDWEVPRIGDPAEDLSFFLQCCGSGIDRDEALRLHRELSGHKITEFRLRYYDVLSCGKVLMSGLSATTMYQATDPALIDWCQMPILWFGMFHQHVEEKIAAAEAARGR